MVLQVLVGHQVQTGQVVLQVLAELMDLQGHRELVVWTVLLELAALQVLAERMVVQVQAVLQVQMDQAVLQVLMVQVVLQVLVERMVVQEQVVPVVWMVVQVQAELQELQV